MRRLLKRSLGLVAVVLVSPAPLGCGDANSTHDCRTEPTACVELMYCDQATGACLVGCGSDEQCEGPNESCNTDTHECDCNSGSVRCDDFCIDEIEPTLAAIQVDIFDNVGCSAIPCHGAEVPPFGLDLSSVDTSEASLVSVESGQSPQKLRVAPGDSGASYLMNKILGVDMAPDTERMPLVAPPLCDARIEAVRAWIDAGAPIN